VTTVGVGLAVDERHADGVLRAIAQHYAVADDGLEEVNTVFVGDPERGQGAVCGVTKPSLTSDQLSRR